MFVSPTLLYNMNLLETSEYIALRHLNKDVFAAKKYIPQRKSCVFEAKKRRWVAKLILALFFIL